jgi:hypothetical protein
VHSMKEEELRFYWKWQPKELPKIVQFAQCVSGPVHTILLTKPHKAMRKIPKLFITWFQDIRGCSQIQNIPHGKVLSAPRVVVAGTPAGPSDGRKQCIIAHSVSPTTPSSKCCGI